MPWWWPVVIIGCRGFLRWKVSKRLRSRGREVYFIVNSFGGGSFIWIRFVVHNPLLPISLLSVNLTPRHAQKVVVVGASVSAADIAYDLAHSRTAQTPVHAITVGHTFNGYFGDEAFKHPRIENHPSISRVCPKTRTVHLVDGTSIPNVDHIIFGTGYSWTLPFLSQVLPVRNNRVPDLYQHVVWQQDPSLLFVGAVGAGLTFKVFEWQAVYAARILAGRAQVVPTVKEMQEWEEERIKEKGDGPKFSLIYPEFEDYFETLRRLAGEGETARGVGRKLPRFRPEWFRAFMEGHDLRKRMWKRVNKQAREEDKFSRAKL